MPIDDTVPVAGAAVSAPIRGNFEALKRMLGAFTEDWTGLGGRLIKANAEATPSRGPRPAGDGEPIDGGGDPLINVTPDEIDVPGSLTIDGTNVATYRGKVLLLSTSSTATVTINASVGVKFSCTLLRTGTGAKTVAVAGGATLRNRLNHTKLAGQWSMATVYLSAGNNLVLQGDTSA